MDNSSSSDDPVAAWSDRRRGRGINSPAVSGRRHSATFPTVERPSNCSLRFRVDQCLRAVTFKGLQRRMHNGFGASAFSFADLVECVLVISDPGFSPLNRIGWARSESGICSIRLEKLPCRFPNTNKRGIFPRPRSPLLESRNITASLCSWSRNITPHGFTTTFDLKRMAC